MRAAMVGAEHATHMTSALPQTFHNPSIQVARFPVSQPIEQIVAGLNAYQPVAVMGYPSMLALLAAEARAGRLRILPKRITTTSEPLAPEVRRALAEAFGAPVANMYGTSEAGPVGSAAGAVPASTSATTWSSSSRSTWPAVPSRPGSARTRCT
jgi:phenylacetate-CoA ligase